MFDNDIKNEFENKINFLYFIKNGKFFEKPTIVLEGLSYQKELGVVKLYSAITLSKAIATLLWLNKMIFVLTLSFIQFAININYFEKFKNLPHYLIFFKKKFYSQKILYNLSYFNSKYNFYNLTINNLTFYLSLIRYSAIFISNDTNKVVLQRPALYSVLPLSREITELKPDKLKKIFFKKKQIKVFTYFNEIKKKLKYINIEDTDSDTLKKHLFYKNIFINSNYISNSTVRTTFYSKKNYISNKSVLFWKHNSPNSLYKIIMVPNYIVSKFNFLLVYPLKSNKAYNFENNLSTLNFVGSYSFEDTAGTILNRDNTFKKIFLYNFINLYSKVGDIPYNSKYNNMSHMLEFKDYFFKKNNSTARDVIVCNFKNLNKFNNFFPLYCLSFKKFKKLILFSKKQQSPIYSSYYMYYLINFLELVCKKKIWVRVNTKKQISDEVYSKFIILFNKNKADQINIGKYFFLIEFYEIIYLSFINRDINFFAMWFKKIMEKIHLKKHRKVVKVIHGAIRNNPIFLELTGTKGFSMDVRGKLGTAGNSKKRHYAFTVGSIAPTTKSHGLNLGQTTVRTSTGVLGVTILMSY